MYFRNGSRLAGTKPTAIGIVAVALLAGDLASAETIFTVNGTVVDSAVVDVYFASRLGNANTQPTPEQRAVLMTELRDIYVLSTQEIASELIQDSKFAAQIEFQRQNTIARAVVATIFAEFTVTEEELLAEYDEQLKQAPPLQFKARHILVATQSAAVDVIGRLDGGANFEELAKEVSTGPTAASGGDLDWFTPNQMVAPFSTAVAAMEDGVYTSTPVQTQFGWHVILREDSRESTPPTFESVRDAISQQVQQKKFEAHMKILRTAADK